MIISDWGRDNKAFITQVNDEYNQELHHSFSITIALLVLQTSEEVGLAITKYMNSKGRAASAPTQRERHRAHMRNVLVGRIQKLEHNFIQSMMPS